ncbi:MAG TPA: dienelactone hydrolase family protein [Brevundimonas sp.]|nr:dienelactone hydrolase family protein [Brevundimonas sp.]
MSKIDFTRALRSTAVLLIGAVGCGSGALAQTAPTPPRVGVPGCSDDVAVQASRELIRFESRGRPIRAYLYAPRGDGNGSGIVMLHGGTGFEMNSILFDAHAIQLASRGYTVILPAYFEAAPRGGNRPTVTARAWRQAALDSAERLTATAAVSSERVALWGFSRGAGVALDAAAADGGGVRSAVLVAGAGPVEGDLADRDLSFLLLHARRDEAVPARATLRTADDLREAGAAVQVQELPFDSHQYDLPTWCEVFARTRTFLETRSGR